MSVIGMSASAGHNLSQTDPSTSARDAVNEDGACRAARLARRLIAVSALALAGRAQESVLHLMK